MTIKHDKQHDASLVEHCALLEEKNRDLIARIRVLSEEKRAAENILDVKRADLIGKTCDTVFNCFKKLSVPLSRP